MCTITPEAAALRPSARSVKRASSMWYWAALALAVVGLALAAVWGVGSVTDANDRASAFPHTSIPGTATVMVAEPGDQMIYFTGGGQPGMKSLALEVRDPAGARVPVTPYDLAVEIDLAGDVGRAIATFPADSPGAYTVRSTGSSHPDGVVAVGDNVTRQVLPDVLGALALAWFAVVCAIAMVIVTLLRRSTRAS
jgi:hypothetical protein